MTIEPFLSIVASSIKEKFGNDIFDLVLVFPNRRSILFFNEYWVGSNDSPQIMPTRITIQDFFRKNSYLTVADNLSLSLELYKTIEDVAPNLLSIGEKSFEDFYFWGETVISDFDDIDKNLVDSSSLFANISDEYDITSKFFSLEPAQKEALTHFFSTFDEEEQKKKFAHFAELWNKFNDIYISFKSILKEKSLCYEGMLVRNIVDEIKSGKEKIDLSKHYVFIGFNLLDKSTRTILKWLQKNKRASFYWDYDDFYVNDPTNKHEAGENLRNNLSDFPNEIDSSYFKNLKKNKNVTFVNVSSDNVQTQYLSEYLEKSHSNSNGDKDSENTIVLCDESLLLPVLHSIPEKYDDGKGIYVNVTMGFPVVQTPVFTLIKNLTDFYSYISYSSMKEDGSFPLVHIAPVLTNPYFNCICPGARSLYDDFIENHHYYIKFNDIPKYENGDVSLKYVSSATDFIGILLSVIKSIGIYHSKNENENNTSSDHLFTDLYHESLFRVYQVLVRLNKVVSDTDIVLTIKLCGILLVKMLRTENVPFDGEPVKGLQIMGFLETRGLDFENVCILSCTEGNLPPKFKMNSFIPMSLRYAFDMTTVKNKNSLYSYYFYRLIQRAANITMLYNSSVKGSQISRYVLQMLVDMKSFGYTFEHISLNSELELPAELPISVNKTTEIIDTLVRNYTTNGRSISPSALNSYIDCKLQFYFRHVLHIYGDDDDESEIKDNEFGNIFHSSMQRFYDRLGESKKKEEDTFVVDLTDLEPYSTEVSKENIEYLLSLIDYSINTEYYHIKEESKHKKSSQFSGRLLFNRDILLNNMITQLKSDYIYCKESLNKEFVYVASEKEVKKNLPVIVNGKKIEVSIGGTIDRIDIRDGQIRVVDYKTGRASDSAIINDIYDFIKVGKSRPHYELQTVIYSSILYGKLHRSVKPYLSYINNNIPESFNQCGRYDIRLQNIIDENQKETLPLIVDGVFDSAFSKMLEELVGTIFDKDIPFGQTEDPERSACQSCKFKSICRY